MGGKIKNFKWSQWENFLISVINLTRSYPIQYGFGRNTSITLTKYSFQHRDYLDWYTKYLPRVIYEKIDDIFNCEDIAMSLMISALTGGEAPIIVDELLRTLKLDLGSSTKLSTKPAHYQKRSYCVDSFSMVLGLKNGPNPLQTSTETTADIINSIDSESIERHVALAKKFDELTRTNQLDSYRKKLQVSMMMQVHAKRSEVES